MSCVRFWAHFVLLLRSDLDDQQTHLSWLNIRSSSAATLGLTKFTNARNIIFVTCQCCLSSILNVSITVTFYVDICGSLNSNFTAQLSNTLISIIFAHFTEYNVVVLFVVMLSVAFSHRDAK